MAGGLEMPVVRRDGSEVPITGRVAATDTAFGQVAFVTITERGQSAT
jgi:hypothetical protein